LAAHRAGIRRVILPNNNERDIDDVPEATRAEMEFVLATDMSEVLAAALEETKSSDVPVVPPGAASAGEGEGAAA
jgi:ATP-dependent Lon protease